MKTVTIGICAYNEEGNIDKLLNRLSDEKFNFILKEIILVVSGCTDRTLIIAKIYSKKKKKIKLIVEKIRRGKASAVNLILKNASGKIIVFIDADNLPKIGSINKLILPFSNDGIGGATSRVIPLTKSYIVNLTWNLHHKINLVKPKVNGQFYAIRRNIIDNIPHDIICDDAYIEAMLRKKNYKTVYVSEAVTYAQTPKKLQNILKQRRRISRGYIQLFDMGLDVSIPYKTKLELVAKEMQKKPLDFPKIFLAVLIETSANILAYYDTLNKKTPYCWEKVT